MPIIIIHNVETGEIEEREMNPEELTQYNADLKKEKEIKAVKEMQEAAKSALLEKLGITENEAKLLLS